METRFEVTYVPDRKTCQEFGAITVRRQKSYWVLLGCCLVILLVLYPLCMLNETSSAYQSLCIFSVVMFYFWLMLGWNNGIGAYRNLDHLLHGSPMTHAFCDDGLHVYTGVQDAHTRYDAIVQVLETPNLFAIYISKNAAHLIPKRALQEGTLEDFRTYLGEVTGKPVQQVRGKRHPVVTWCLGIGMAVLATAVLVCMTFVQKERKERPVTLTQDGYSISLPGVFRKTTQEDAVFAAHSKEVFVAARQQEGASLYEAWENPELTAKDFAVKVQEMNSKLQEMELHDLNQGTVCLTYVNEVDGAMYFYCEAIEKVADTFWVTQFICDAENRFTYHDSFLQWAETISIEPEV